MNNNVDLLIYHPANSAHKSSQYIFLNEYKAQLYANNVFTVSSMNIRSLTSNLQSFIDIIGFSETRLDNYSAS